MQTQRKDFELDHLVKSVMEQSDVKDINTVKESIREMRSPGGEPSKPRDEASWQPEPSKVPGRKGESVSSSGGTGSSIKSQEQVEAEYNLEKKKKAAGKGGTEKG